MAGEGKSFHDVGYSFPKPLIDINEKTMIQIVVENLNLVGNYIFICKKDHYEKYSMYDLLNLINPDCKIIQVNEKTEGAAKTLLLAKDLINNEDELIIANSDQWLDWNQNHFLSFLRGKNADGGIVTFISTHPRWSFVKVDNNGLITQVAEKKPISNIATAGIYYFKHGKDFVWAAEQMIEKNIMFNNEFYYAPSFNELIETGKKIYSYPAAEMRSLGTPEDVSKFVTNTNKTISTES
jgi:NDP-sugar pyrophosphorylase family protein